MLPPNMRFPGNTGNVHVSTVGILIPQGYSGAQYGIASEEAKEQFKFMIQG